MLVRTENIILQTQQTTPEFRYQYNGKEKTEDLGLMWTNFGNRHQDPRLCRFWGLDRFAEKYLSLTPFHYAANNPILFVDVNGDSTTYYDSRGNHLFTAQDSRTQHYLTVITDANLAMFGATLDGFQSSGIAHNSKANAFLRKQYGASYDLNEIVNFKKGEKERLSSYGTDTNGDKLVNEKMASIKLNRETGVFELVDVHVSRDYEGAPERTGQLQIHTHDNWQDKNFWWSRQGFR